MLERLHQGNYGDYIDFAYALALDRTKSSYPTYTDGLKTKEDFVRVAAGAFDSEREEVLIFREGERVLGWIHYYAIPEDRYIGLQSFLTAERTAQAMGELLERLGEKYPGYRMYFGFPEENTEALEDLKARGFQLGEESLAGVVRFEDYTPLPETGEITKITRENFEKFAKIHAKMDGEMYWDNAHLLEDLDRWHIYLLGDRAAIYFVYVEQSMEIFGIDFVGEFDPQDFRALLVRALNQGKADGCKDMTFFHEAEEHPVVEALGLRNVGSYVMYRREL